MKQSDESQKTVNEKEATNIAPRFNYLSAIMGLLLMILIVVLLVVFPDINEQQYEVFRVVLSIACGAFAATISGFLNIEYKGIIQASGGLGVLVLVYFFQPAGTETKNIDLTIFLESTTGQTVLRNQGQLQLKIGNEKRLAEIGMEGSAVFKNISTSALQDSLALEISADGWLFDNQSTVIPLQFNKQNITVQVVRDPTWCCIKGMVTDERGSSLGGVTLTIGNTHSISAANGYFEIKVSVPDERYTLYAQKEGYQTWIGQIKSGPDAQEIILNPESL